MTLKERLIKEYYTGSKLSATQDCVSQLKVLEQITISRLLKLAAQSPNRLLIEHQDGESTIITGTIFDHNTFLVPQQQDDFDNNVYRANGKSLIGNKQANFRKA
jgi:hypothetical protein